MPIDYDLLGQRIAFYRTQVSLSQEKLAEVVHVSKQHISKIEQGRNRPSPDLLVDIAAAVNVTLDDLLADSLQHSSGATRLHQLLDDCSPAEETIIIKNAENLKQILDELNIK